MKKYSNQKLLKLALLLAFSPLFLFSTLKAQYYNSELFAATKEVSVYSSKYKLVILEWDQFILKNDFKLFKKNSDANRCYYEIAIPSKQLYKLDSLAQLSGNILSENQETHNVEYEIVKLRNSIEENDLSIENLENRNKNLAESIKRKSERVQETTQEGTTGNGSIDGPRNSIDQLSQTIENNSQQIQRLKRENRNHEKRILEIQKNNEYTFVRLTILDELSTPDGRNQKITWVNMPGVSYSLLQIENPKIGISHDYYSGMMLKYLFTRGKSYVEIGVLKPINPLSGVDVNDTQKNTTKDEFFKIQFGQDFYPRHFGRGKRRFMNLYSGYAVGMMIPNQYNGAKLPGIPLCNLNMGVEILKTKHVLLDSRVAYFLPLDALNRNTRGILYNVALNFVF